VNVGIVSGGSRTNVVPAEAAAQIDVRIARLKDAAGIEKKDAPACVPSPQVQNRNQRRNESSSDGADGGVAALYAQAKPLPANWDGTWRSGGGRRLRWQFHGGAGHPYARRSWGVGDGAHAIHEHILISNCRAAPR